MFLLGVPTTPTDVAESKSLVFVDLNCRFDRFSLRQPYQSKIKNTIVRIKGKGSQEVEGFAAHRLEVDAKRI